ncbi:hypothetical protein DSM104299_02315 [Baekduia alba]|nr:hypothetical protein DSM104299_02315 [Baekduia alba]
MVPALRDGTLRDRSGLLVGRVEDMLFDAETNRPAWMVVRLSEDGGGHRRTLAPARGARPSVGGMVLGVTAEVVRSCSVTVTSPAPLVEHVAAACRHYGVRRFPRGDAFTSAAPGLEATRAA